MEHSNEDDKSAPESSVSIGSVAPSDRLTVDGDRKDSNSSLEGDKEGVVVTSTIGKVEATTHENPETEKEASGLRESKHEISDEDIEASLPSVPLSADTDRNETNLVNCGTDDIADTIDPLAVKVEADQSSNGQAEKVSLNSPTPTTLPTISDSFNVSRDEKQTTIGSDSPLEDTDKLNNTTTTIESSTPDNQKIASKNSREEGDDGGDDDDDALEDTEKSNNTTTTIESSTPDNQKIVSKNSREEGDDGGDDDDDALEDTEKLNNTTTAIESSTPDNQKIVSKNSREEGDDGDDDDDALEDTEKLNNTTTAIESSTPEKQEIVTESGREEGDDDALNYTKTTIESSTPEKQEIITKSRREEGDDDDALEVNKEVSQESLASHVNSENTERIERESEARIKSSSAHNSETSNDSAVKKKEVQRVSELVSKYTDSPTKNNASVTSFHPEDMPKVGSIRALFEESSKSCDNGGGSASNGLVFGEAFRQKQRFHRLADREQKTAAQINLRGYNELRGATGEIDTSALEKTYSFQAMEDEGTPHNGTCKVDFKNHEYQGMVFVVHRTRGMLLLNCDVQNSSGEHANSTLASNAKSAPTAANISGATRIPGGTIVEDEYVMSAQQTGHPSLQLQLAAREGAARHLYETTGIDMRNHVQRLTPAVLQTNPQLNDVTGTKSLKNENDNKLYYFLQVSDEDFLPSESSMEGTALNLTTPVGETNSPIKPNLSGGFSDFTFVKEPGNALTELKEHGDIDVTKALELVMNQAVSQSENENPAGAAIYEGTTKPTARVLQLSEEDEWTGTLTTVGEGDKETSPEKRLDDEADLKPKPSVDSTHPVEVSCCCSFW